MREFISFQDAREIVLDAVAPVELERVALTEALERTLAESIRAGENIPPFDNSAMDGYALRAEDVPSPGTELECVGEIAAGHSPDEELPKGACFAIMTGAPLPSGADTVIPIEEAQRAGESVRFNTVPSAGDHVRRAGEDLRRGDVVMDAGRVITPGMIAVMASLGHAEIAVARRPTVAVVTTGSELVDVRASLKPGQIRDSNGPALAALIETAGAKVLGPWRARDEPGAIRSCLLEALAADVVLVSGGVSVGEYDLVKDELDTLGMDLLFWKVRQKPGKPLAFGRIDGTPIFGLPGNPVSSAVCFEQYVRPALARMLGRTAVTRPLASATLSASVPKKAGLHTFARGSGRWVDGKLLVEPAARQGSHVASSLVEANGLVHLPEDLDEAPAGLDVKFEFFNW